VGTFFAQQGFVHIVMDYRLLEHGATYPSGPEDVSLALQWLAGGNVKQADLNNVFLLGESAG
jgi:acetyl esterase/lipase